MPRKPKCLEDVLHDHIDSILATLAEMSDVSHEAFRAAYPANDPDLAFVHINAVGQIAEVLPSLCTPRLNLVRMLIDALVSFEDDDNDDKARAKPESATAPPTPPPPAIH